MQSVCEIVTVRSERGPLFTGIDKLRLISPFFTHAVQVPGSAIELLQRFAGCGAELPVVRRVAFDESHQVLRALFQLSCSGSGLAPAIGRSADARAALPHEPGDARFSLDELLLQ